VHGYTGVYNGMLRNLRTYSALRGFLCSWIKQTAAYAPKSRLLGESPELSIISTDAPRVFHLVSVIGLLRMRHINQTVTSGLLMMLCGTGVMLFNRKRKTSAHVDPKRPPMLMLAFNS
jgi:hypothetical protein